MKIFFSFCGVGYGHASRSLKLGNELEKRGHNVIYATHDPLYKKLKKKVKMKKIGQELVLVHKNHTLDKKETFLKTFFNNIEKLPKFFVDEFKQVYEINPDLIISDSHFSTYLIANILKKPLVSIQNNTNVHSFFGNYILKESSKYSLKKVLEMSKYILVPDFPKPYCVCCKGINFYGLRNKFKFTGPLINKKPDLKKFKKKTVVIGTGGVVISKEIEDELRKNYYGSDINFIFFNKKPKKDKNFIYKGFSDKYDYYLRKSHCLITHGGHSSLMEACVYGIPMISIPIHNHDEAQYNSIGVEKNEIGIYLKRKNIDKLGDCLEKIFSKDYKNIKKYHKLYENYNGVQNGADIIESVIK